MIGDNVPFPKDCYTLGDIWRLIEKQNEDMPDRMLINKEELNRLMRGMFYTGAINLDQLMRRAHMIRVGKEVVHGGGPDKDADKFIDTVMRDLTANHSLLSCGGEVGNGNDG